MSRINLISGPYNSLFLGLAAATGTPLQNLNAIGTNGYQITQNLSRPQWKRCTNSFVAQGLTNFQLTLAFLGDSDVGEMLCKGNNPFTSTRSAPITYPVNQFALLLVDESSDTCVFIPICEPDTEYNMNRNKTTASSVSLKFRWADYRSFYQFYYKDTLANIETIMNSRGNQNPF